MASPHLSLSRLRIKEGQPLSLSFVGPDGDLFREARVGSENPRRTRRLWAAAVVASLAFLVIGTGLAVLSMAVLDRSAPTIPFLGGTLYFHNIVRILFSVAVVQGAAGIVGVWAGVTGFASAGRGPGERSLSPGTVRMLPDGIEVQLPGTVGMLPDGIEVQLRDLITSTLTAPTMFPTFRTWARGPGGRSLLMGRDDVAAGWCEPSGPHVVAVLERRGGDLVLVEMPDEGGARDLLAHMGVDEAAQTVRLSLGRDDVAGRAFRAALLVPLVVVGVPMILLPFVAVGAMVAAPCRMPPSAAAVSVVVALPLVWLLWWLGGKLLPSRVVVGRDGLLVGVWVRKFLPFARMADASLGVYAEVGGGPVYFHVKLSVDDGKTVRIPAATRGQAEEVARHIDAAWQAFESGGQADLVEGLARGTRSVAEWRVAVEGLLSQGAYRARSVTAEQLVRIAASPGLLEEARVAAVLAVRWSIDDDGRGRVVRAAQGSASPRTRTALVRALDGVITDEELGRLQGADR